MQKIKMKSYIKTFESFPTNSLWQFPSQNVQHNEVPFELIQGGTLDGRQNNATAGS